MAANIYSQKDELFEALEKDAINYYQISTLIDQIYAYQWDNQNLTSITADTRRDAAAYLNSP